MYKTSRSGMLLAGLFLCASGRGAQIEHANVAFDVSPDGKVIAFSAADGDLYLLNRTSRKVDRLTRTTATESRPRFSTDGRSLVYSSWPGVGDGRSLFIYSLKTRKARQLTTDPRVFDCAPVFSRDGSKIAFFRAQRLRPYSFGGTVWTDYDVHTVNVDGTGLRQVTKHKYHRASSLAFGKGDREVLFSAEIPHDSVDTREEDGGSIMALWTIPTMGQSEPKAVLPLPKRGPNTGVFASEVAVSRDGNRIAFLSDRNDGYDVCVMVAARKVPRALGVTKVAGYNQQPVFGPGGKTVLFLAGTEKGAGDRPIFSLWEVGFDGRHPIEIADSGLFSNPSTWKPKARH